MSRTNRRWIVTETEKEREFICLVKQTMSIKKRTLHKIYSGRLSEALCWSMLDADDTIKSIIYCVIYFKLGSSIVMNVSEFQTEGQPYRSLCLTTLFFTKIALNLLCSFFTSRHFTEGLLFQQASSQPHFWGEGQSYLGVGNRRIWGQAPCGYVSVFQVISDHNITP